VACVAPGGPGKSSIHLKEAKRALASTNPAAGARSLSGGAAGSAGNATATATRARTRPSCPPASIVPARVARRRPRLPARPPALSPRTGNTDERCGRTGPQFAVRVRAMRCAGGVWNHAIWRGLCRRRCGYGCGCGCGCRAGRRGRKSGGSVRVAWPGCRWPAVCVRRGFLWLFRGRTAGFLRGGFASSSSSFPPRGAGRLIGVSHIFVKEKWRGWWKKRGYVTGIV
jgi:hypothetical protein